MNKNLSLGLAFLVVWGLASGICRLLGLIFDWAFFWDWANIVVYGFSIAIGALFGPIVAAYFEKKFKKRKV